MSSSGLAVARDDRVQRVQLALGRAAGADGVAAGAGDDPRRVAGDAVDAVGAGGRQAAPPWSPTTRVMPPTMTSTTPSSPCRTVAPTWSASFMTSRSRWSERSLAGRPLWFARWIAWLRSAIVLRGGVHVGDQHVEALAGLGPLRAEGGLAEVDAADQGLQALEHLPAGGLVLRLVGDVLPAGPHVRQQALDAGVAGLAERLLDQLVGLVLDGQPGAVGVLGVPAALQEGVADAGDVVGADAAADAGAGGEEGGDDAAADAPAGRPAGGSSPRC